MAIELTRHILRRPGSSRRATHQQQYLELLDRGDVLVDEPMDVVRESVHRGWPVVRVLATSSISVSPAPLGDWTNDPVNGDV